MSTNAYIDPYKKYKFRVVIAGFPVAGFTKVGTVGQEMDNIEYRHGDDQNAPYNFRGLAKHPPFSLERGITADVSFHLWAKQCYNAAEGKGFPLYKKEVIIEQLDEANIPVKMYPLKGAYVKKYEAGDWDSLASEVAIEKAEIQYDGFLA